MVCSRTILTVRYMQYSVGLSTIWNGETWELGNWDSSATAVTASGG